MKERRKSRRIPVFAAGTIGFRGRYRLRCLVQNLCKAGAKLSLEKAADLPDVFTLNFCHRGVRVTYQARAKWRASTEIGVEFTAPAIAEFEPLHGLAVA